MLLEVFDLFLPSAMPICYGHAYALLHTTHLYYISITIYHLPVAYLAGFNWLSSRQPISMYFFCN